MEIESEMMNSRELIQENIINIKNIESYNFKKEFIQWLCQYNISHQAIGALLNILKNVQNISKLLNLSLDS